MLCRKAWGFESPRRHAHRARPSRSSPSSFRGGGARLARMLSKDTQLCISMSGRPSNIGTRFHNRLYDELGLDFVYKAFSPVDLAQAVAGIRGLPIRGAAVSMPFKEQVIPIRRARRASG